MKNLVIPLINAWGKRIESKRFVNPPVYIGGCGRSGTTLLLSILSAHPEIFGCPRELNLFENGRLEKEQLVLPKYYRLYRTFIREPIPASADTVIAPKLRSRARPATEGGQVRFAEDIMMPATAKPDSSRSRKRKKKGAKGKERTEDGIRLKKQRRERDISLDEDEEYEY